MHILSYSWTQTFRSLRVPVKQSNQRVILLKAENKYNRRELSRHGWEVIRAEIGSLFTTYF